MLKRDSRLSLLLVPALALSLAGAAHAQDPGGFRRPGGFQGGFGGPGMSLPGMGGPANLIQLLTRSEVQSHLKLTIRQKNELGLTPAPANGAGGQGGAADPEAARRRDQMRQRFREMGEKMRDLPEEERRQKMREMGEQVRGEFEAARTARDEKIKEVLTPEQYQRLLALDLQFRGPLALGDAKVAEQIKIAPERRAPISAAANEAQTQIRQAIFESMGFTPGGPQQGADPGTVPGAGAGRRQQRSQRAQGGQRGRGGAGFGQLQQDMKNRLSPVRQKVDKTRKAAEEKILALLSAEESARWTAALGEPFSFRTDQ